jgi:hypothetical protein
VGAKEHVTTGRAQVNQFSRNPGPHRQSSDIMMRFYRTISLLCCLLGGPSALAEHQTYLRAIVNVPGFQVALLEIDYILEKPSHAPPVVIKTSRLVPAGDHFEDQTIKGAYFRFEVLEADLAKETVGNSDTFSLVRVPRH